MSGLPARRAMSDDGGADGSGSGFTGDPRWQVAQCSARAISFLPRQTCHSDKENAPTSQLPHLGNPSVIFWV